jgi:hypothetical protein|tara:strand:- start:377 stop:583 length:207 start_codon:yes stop_codon:yes gene_type:complete
MSEERGANLSAAFDAMLEKNWQRLDALHGGSPNVGAPTSRPATAAAPAPAGAQRGTGCCEGKSFSFDS